MRKHKVCDKSKSPSGPPIKTQAGRRALLTAPSRAWNELVTRRLCAAFILAFIASFGVAVARAAESCACKHLESVQQELENSLYGAKFFSEMSKRLGEIRLIKDRADPDSRLSVHELSERKWVEIMKEFKLPHDWVKDYTGPASVPLIRDTCKNAPADLDGLKRGASCKELGTITLAHEAAHRAKCQALGVAKYWSRPLSEHAAEEAERYADQAAEMRKLLKKLIASGVVKVAEEREFSVFDITYHFLIAPIGLEDKSSPAEPWLFLEGTGKLVTTEKKGMNRGRACTPTGEVNDMVSAILKTDGLSMSLWWDVKPMRDLYIRCNAPGARPGDEKRIAMGFMSENGFKVPVFSDKRFMRRSEFVQDASAAPFAISLARSGGGLVSGTQKTIVELDCPAR